MFGMESKNTALYALIALLSFFSGALCISVFYWKYQLCRAFGTIRSLQDENLSLQQLALHDSLTGLPNRGLFEDRLQHAIDKATRARSSFAIFFIDLDGFKIVNDMYGHDVGDLLLVEVAQRLRNVVREEDTVARLGGDEFIILAQITELENATLVTGKLMAAISAPLSFTQNAVRISASVGVATFPRDGASIAALMKIADAAMYKSKYALRDSVANFEGRSKLPHIDDAIRSRHLGRSLE